MRHPLAMLAALVVVAGLEWWIFAATAESDPAAVRFVMVTSCLLIVLLWFLARTMPAASTPTWPGRHVPATTPYVDSRTRHLETLLTAGTPAASRELADVLADLLPPEAAVSPDLTDYLTAARAGRDLRPPSPRQLGRWLSEIENSR